MKTIRSIGNLHSIMKISTIYGLVEMNTTFLREENAIRAYLLLITKKKKFVVSFYFVFVFSCEWIQKQNTKKKNV